MFLWHNRFTNVQRMYVTSHYLLPVHNVNVLLVPSKYVCNLAPSSEQSNCVLN